MVGFIFGIVALIVGIVLAITLNGGKALYVLGGIVLGFVLTFLGCMAPVETGNTGVVTTFGKVEDYTLEAGFHMKAPWNSVVQMDNRVQKETVSLSCFSSDIQEVSMEYTLNYQIDKTNAQEIYKTIGKDYYKTVIQPNIAEAVKVITARYTAEQLVQTRNTLAASIEELLQDNLTKYNIKVVSTAIEDMDFTDAFTNAVEAKQVAEQKKKQAEIEQAQELLKAENDKNIAMTKAQADAEVAKIQAQADMEVAKIGADSAAYQGKKQSAVLLRTLAGINGWTAIESEDDAGNPVFQFRDSTGATISADVVMAGVENLMKYTYYQNWDGVLPVYYMGSLDGVSILLDANSEN